MRLIRITYVARSFLDYRIPVLGELDKLCGRQLYYISSPKKTPARVLDRLRGVLGDRAIYLPGERSIGVDSPQEANKTFCLPYQLGLLKAIAATKPDVVVGDGFFQWTYVALLHRMLRGTPLVICYERWAHTERSAQLYRRLYRRFTLKWTASVSCNGVLSTDYVCSLGFPRPQITTGHMAADTEKLAQDAASLTPEMRALVRFSWHAEGVVFLFVGRLIKIKGLRELLNAWTMLGREPATRATLVVVGDGPEHASLKSEVESMKVHNVRLIGSVDYDRMGSYYAAADVLVMPGLEDNWSLVVPEAMSCGLPILCSKYNGCWPELVREGRNGWVFDPLDPQNTLECLHRALESAPQLAGMGRESLEIVSHYSPKHAAQAIFSACELALGRAGNPASTTRS
jgi:glycosyltransferase involved in cell wall biosynthesis